MAEIEVYTERYEREHGHKPVEGVAFEYEVLGTLKPVPISGRTTQARRERRGH